MTHFLPVEDFFKKKIKKYVPLSGGCVGEVYLVHLDDLTPVVVKVSEYAKGTLDVEGHMLQDLKSLHFPVPNVYLSRNDVLAMEYIEGSSLFDPDSQVHAAELLVKLHSHSADAYGYDYDTVIAAIPQPNDKTKSWIEFFREKRLLYMAELARKNGELPSHTYDRILRFAEQLHKFLLEPRKPSLIHGDIWSGNVICRRGKIQAFIDPAIYYAHNEVELAFITMFHTFNEDFFKAYDERMPIDKDFWTIRKDIYNLYPLLVHTYLFGSAYAQQVDHILKKYLPENP